MGQRFQDSDGRECRPPQKSTARGSCTYCSPLLAPLVSSKGPSAGKKHVLKGLFSKRWNSLRSVTNLLNFYLKVSEIRSRFIEDHIIRLCHTILHPSVWDYPNRTPFLLTIRSHMLQCVVKTFVSESDTSGRMIVWDIVLCRSGVKENTPKRIFCIFTCDSGMSYMKRLIPHLK